MDTPETLAAEMIRAATAAIAVTKAVVRKGALNVKNEGRRNAKASASTHNAGAPSAITYDTKISAMTFEAEIGYDKDKPGGSLGNLLEYGSRNNGGHRDLGRAMDDEEPRFERALADAIEDLL